MDDNNLNLIKKAQEGDKQALDQLTKQNSNLIWSIVRRFYGRNYEKDDLYQIGAVGFIKAVKRFDIGLGVKLSTYAVVYILGEIKRFIRDDRYS